MYPYASTTEATNRGRKGRIELYSPKYYAACALGGMFACGPTHTAVTPLDLVKCRRQVNPKLYASNIIGWRTIARTEGLSGIFTGWSPTLLGYSAQGVMKYGGYEFFKKTYSDLAGGGGTVVYLAASASAEMLADVALCPLEAVKVRMQTTVPPLFKGVREGVGSVFAKEGLAGLYKGLYPLWARQVPYTMTKFATFETAVDLLYKALPGRKRDYGGGAQTAVSFVAGYAAGVLCAVISHPADVMVSMLNADGGRGPGESAVGALGRLYKQVGARGLWNGLPVRIVMVGSLTGMQWLLYDSFKIFVGLPTTGGEQEE
ncbi:Cu/Pi carrier [Maublancomyces gigas]|uniref:Cu/Pi carrier n=1 Tax=Discina gigas TaxID=1032678 RepID=A0ABR3GKA1_9PEZI